MTQRQQVLAALINQPSVCLADVPLELGYTLRNRISELRRDGHNIVSEPCTKHRHEGTIVRYHLIQPKPVQETLPV